MVEKEVIREMNVPKGTVNIHYTGTFDYDDFQSRLNLSALCDILDVRYVETIREEQGGTYGAAVYEQMDKYPYENYTVTIFFDCDPQNAEKLKGHRLQRDREAHEGRPGGQGFEWGKGEQAKGSPGKPQAEQLLVECHLQ